jgi:hypothetical protein
MKKYCRFWCWGPIQSKFEVRQMLWDLRLRRWLRDLAERARWLPTCSAPRKPLRKI